MILDDSEPVRVSRVYRTFVNVPARSQIVLQSVRNRLWANMGTHGAKIRQIQYLAVR